MTDMKGYRTTRIEVTVVDLDTGDVLDRKTLSDDFMLICCGNRYVKSWQMWGSTVQMNIAVAKPGDR